MELVYLWVEDYKNIKKQGFNFSPRFHCEYNEEDNELTITENNDYIPDFFGKNINITAIVGKNGSGKSGIIKFIRLILKHFSGEYIKTPIWMMLFYDSIQDELYCLAHQHLVSLKIEGKYVKKTIIYVYDTSIDQNEFQNIPFLEKAIFPLLDYSLSYDNPISLRNFYNKPKSNRFLDFPNKSERNIYLYNEHIETMRRVFQNFKELNQRNHWKIFENFFYPKYLSISFNMESFKTLGIGVDNNKAVSKYIKERKKIDIEFIQLFCSRLKKHFNLKHSQLERFRILKKFTDEIYFDIFDNLCQKNNLIIHKKKNRKNEYNIFEFEISNLLEYEIDYLLELSLSEIFTIDIIDRNGKNFNELSFGEQQLLKILNIIYYLSTNKEHEKLLIFLDEIDMGFHPDWQKRTIKYIIDFLFLIPDKNFHLIFTTHSPFLLSDIPKENIIFLNDRLSIKQTFGANIHTLLSDSFFMEDGLMGEFAKSKINEIINFHKEVEEENRKEKSNLTPFKTKYKKLKTKFWQTQSIIGEEYLKQVVKNHLRDIENILLGYNEAKKEEIKRLRAEADRLENM